MKKLVFIPLIVLSTGLFAQTFQIGLKGGVNVSRFVGTTFNNVDNKALIGFHAGTFLSLLFGDNFAIQPELLFSTQGTRISDATNGNQDYKVNYLNVPLMFKYRFPGGFYLEAGPQVGFKLNETAPNHSGGTASDFAKNLDFSIAPGLGFHSKSGIGIGGRYNIGVTKVGNLDNTEFNPNFRNGVAQVFVFFTLLNNKSNP
jgi:hypothetical protein